MHKITILTGIFLLFAYVFGFGLTVQAVSLSNNDYRLGIMSADFSIKKEKDVYNQPQKLAIAYYLGDIEIWEITRNPKNVANLEFKLIWNFKLDLGETGDPAPNDLNLITKIKFSPDETKLAVNSYNKIQILDLGSKQIIQTLNNGSGNLVFSSDSKQLYYAKEKQIMVYNFDQNLSTEITKPGDIWEYANAINIDPEGKFMCITSDAAHGLFIWDIEKKSKVKLYDGLGRSGTSCDFIKIDGQLKVIYSAKDYYTSLFDLGSDKNSAELKYPNSGLMTAGYSGPARNSGTYIEHVLDAPNSRLFVVRPTPPSYTNPKSLIKAQIRALDIESRDTINIYNLPFDVPQSGGYGNMYFKQSLNSEYLVIGDSKQNLGLIDLAYTDQTKSYTLQARSKKHVFKPNKMLPIYYFGSN